MKKKVIITVGAPGSGKSTWAVEEAKKAGTIRINRDDIRTMLGNYWIPERETLVYEMVQALFKEALHDSNYVDTIILDETCLEPFVRLKWLSTILVESPGNVSVEYKTFLDISYDELFHRNRNRVDHGIPDSVVESFWKKMQDPQNSPEALKYELEQWKLANDFATDSEDEPKQGLKVSVYDTLRKHFS